MNLQPDNNHLITYILDWLEQEETGLTIVNQSNLKQAEADLKIFLSHLQAQWWQHQHEQLQLLDHQVTQIIRWTQGELDASGIQQIKQEIADKPKLKAFQKAVQAVTQHIAEVDKPDPVGQVRRFIQKLKPQPPAPSWQPAWGLRSQTTIEPVNLIMPSEYGFQVKLFIGELDQGQRTIEGELVTAEGELPKLPKSEHDMLVWLLPEEGDRWHDAQLSSDTKYKWYWDAVSPGNYRFEMAWADDFWEHLDIIIPDSN